MIGPIAALESFVFKAFDIKGRATRAEYWWPQLILSVVMFCAVFVDILSVANALEVNISPFAYFSPWIALLAFVPQLTVTARRLHDTGRSGLWYLISFVPFVGPLILLVLLCMASEPEENNWGPMRGSGRKPQKQTNDPFGSLGNGATSKAQKAHDPMQGYQVLLNADRPPSAEEQAAKRAQINDYYQNHVLRKASA